MSRRALATAALALLVLGGMAAEVDLDVWHSMALGREALRLGRVPIEDRFAYTPTVFPSMHHEWGMGLLLYGTGAFGGAGGLVALRLALVLAVCTVVWRLAVRRGASEGTLMLLGPAAVAMSWIGWTLIRAHLVTLLFVALLLTALDADRRGGRRWILPWLVAFPLWVNCHAGFVLGIAIVALDGIERVMRRERPWHLLAVALGMLALVLINPYGLAYYRHVWDSIGMDRSLILEWRPVWWAGVPQTALVAFAVVTALYGVARLGIARAAGWLLVALAAYEAVRHQRQVSLLALVWFAYVPAWITMTPLGTLLEWLYARWGTGMAVVMAVAGLILLQRNQPWRARVDGTDGSPPRYAVGPVEWLREVGFEGNLFVPFQTGAYVSWKLHPHVKVSLDSRYEAAYPRQALAEHIEFFRGGPTWRDVLRRAAGTDLVVTPRGAAVRELLAREPGWSIVYDDDGWVVFARPGLTYPYRDRRGERISGVFP
ncbi:MAG TPA: hypothetical protein VNO26_15365 [Candidatus Limnocylindria bacterium]|nr:hypothetical protein [Candidatus Limnocylindria bacterium]